MAKLVEVGGCVRDEILGLVSKDIDYTFILDNLDQSVQDGFKEMSNWMQERNFEIFLSTEEMFTIRAKFPKGDVNEGLVADFVLARKEIGYVENTRRPILILGSLEDDLIRRDFTLNAMAKESDGTIIDLFGGRADLSNKILRTPKDPKITMMDDPLRLLRAWRFSITKGFTIHRSIIDAVIEHPEILTKLKNVVSKERIREELNKMMHHDTVKSLRLINDWDDIVPGIYDTIFSDNMWLKPTFEK
jgi:poly(A) polymerase